MASGRELTESAGWSLMNPQELEQLTELPMSAVNRRIERALQSDVSLISQMGTYIIGAGGKRLRPRLVLISALAHDYRGDQHTNVAAIIEFIHTATLLHDDVVDSSVMRRGRDTANAVWGNEAAVLVGDFLYSRSFEMMVEVGQMRVMEILSAATNTIAAGEVMQLLNVGEADVTEQRYMEVIKAKTAKLFEASAQLGAVLAGTSPEQEKAMIEYGRHLGIAFQLIDDVLDYTADSDELGKNTGDDLAEGKPTLPLIYALRDGGPQTQKAISAALTRATEFNADGTVPDPTFDLQEIVSMVTNSGAIDRTYELAQLQVDKAIKAIEPLQDSQYKQALISIVESSTQRRF